MTVSEATERISVTSGKCGVEEELHCQRPLSADSWTAAGLIRTGRAGVWGKRDSSTGPLSHMLTVMANRAAATIPHTSNSVEG